jgi:CheY-like chemotaxis protein
VTTLLIADDDDDFRSAARMLVSGMADVVTEARNGDEAVKMARAVRPELVLMDVRMPVLDGVEAARRIKSELPDTKVILVTAFDAQALSLGHTGAEAVITKRRVHTHLLPAIRSLLAKAKELWNGLERRQKPATTSPEWDGRERRRAPQASYPPPAESIQFPADLRSFLFEHIEGPLELEVLLFLRTRHDRSFMPSVVAELMHMRRESAAEALERLARRGLIDGPPDSTYRFAPRAGAGTVADLADKVDRLASLYEERRLDVIKLISANAIERVRLAARRLRREEPGTE